MTTAHRPTWNPATGGSDQGGNRMIVPTRQYSAKDLPGQLKMKERPDKDYSKKDFKKDLLERERKSKNPEQDKPALTDPDTQESLEPSLKKQIKADEEEVKTIEDRKPGYINPFPQDADDDGEDDSDKSEKSDEDEKPRKAKSNPDADAESSDSDDDDDDDDNEKLFEEYERIKRERELEQKRKQREREEQLQKQREQELMQGNPLLDGSAYSLQKRWYEDTVFKNQARTEPKEKKRFINDTVRSDFHKKFLNKYILT